MKSKIILALITCALLSSCIKDYYGHGPKDIEFTEENYLYEGDLYIVHLEDEIETLDVKIQEWNDLIAINQGSGAIQDSLEVATTKRELLSEDLQGIVSLEQVGIRLPPPPPPCPRPRNCDFSGLEYVLTDSAVKKIRIIFLDDNGNTIGGGTIDELSPLPSSEGQINFSNLIINGQNVSVSTIQVQVFNAEGTELRNYKVQ